MATVKEIYQYIDGKAPFGLQMDFDNAGFLVGRKDAEVKKVLVALDITEEVVQEAHDRGAQLIVAHHPIIFHPTPSVTDETVTGRVLLALVESGIAAICAHTNLDAVEGGVNDALARALGLSEIDQLCPEGVDFLGRPYGIGRVGTVAEQSPAQFAALVKKNLGAGGLRYVDAGKPIRRVAVGGGACAGMVKDALAQGCDAFVTSDVKYNDFLDAKAQGLTLIDAGHYSTENVVCPVLVDWLQKGFPKAEVLMSRVHHEVFSYL